MKEGGIGVRRESKERRPDKEVGWTGSIGRAEEWK